MRRFAAALVSASLLAVLCATTGLPAVGLAYGIQDDAWIQYGPGTIESRIATLQGLGLRVVRVTVRWDEVERTQGAYDWQRADDILGPLLAQGIDPLVTLYGTPGWANGERPANVAPSRGADFARFAGAMAERYPAVRRWTIWNEPNNRRWLSTASPSQYVTRLLNPAYAAIHESSPQARVAGGVTAPRGGARGLSPVAFIRAMGRARARLDAYAHHPYALVPGETPWSGGCSHCGTITMATLDRLLSETRKAFGPVRIWLTELGYQSDPPDRILGVPPDTQASYIAAAAYRAWAAPRVDLLVQYLYRDEPMIDRWQSGLETATGRPKPAMGGVALPLAQVRRVGRVTWLWGAIRPGSGVRRYRLQRVSGASWVAVGAAASTRPDGTLRRKVVGPPGTRLRLVGSGGTTGNVLVIR